MDEKSSPPPPRRTRRQLQAEQTRRDILIAARDLFAAQGYTATTMTQIGARAMVSPQTIYDSIGPKAEIVRQLNDLIDEEGGVGPLAARIGPSTDPVELLEIAVSISRNINERCEAIIGAVYEAVSAEPELAAVRDDSRRRHKAGISGLTRKLASLDALKPGLEVEAAAGIIAGMTDPQVARTFVLAYGWTWARWHEWTLATLRTLVLK